MIQDSSLLTQPSDQFELTRTFDAPRELVWAAWTECVHLGKWWGPKDFKLVVCDNDIRAGGTFHYCMELPNGGPQMWGKWVYQDVVVPEKLVFVVSFSDADKNIVPHPFAPEWPLETLSILEFVEADGKTLFTLRGWPINATDEQTKAFANGNGSLEQGWKGTLDQLDAHLAQAQA